MWVKARPELEVPGGLFLFGSGGLGLGNFLIEFIDELFGKLLEKTDTEVGVGHDDGEGGSGEGIVGPFAGEDLSGGGLGDVEFVPEVFERPGRQHLVEGDDEAFDKLAVELVLHNSKILCWLAIYRCKI